MIGMSLDEEIISFLQHNDWTNPFWGFLVILIVLIFVATWFAMEKQGKEKYNRYG
jgi:hypothetical protein